MKAFLARPKGGEVFDLALRAGSAERARELISSEGGDVELKELPDAVAIAMAIPAVEGVHKGVVSRWEAGPTNLWGELKSN